MSLEQWPKSPEGDTKTQHELGYATLSNRQTGVLERRATHQLNMGDSLGGYLNT